MGAAQKISPYRPDTPDQEPAISRPILPTILPSC
jgi:hypothetical protein